MCKRCSAQCLVHTKTRSKFAVNRMTNGPNPVLYKTIFCLVKMPLKFFRKTLHEAQSLKSPVRVRFAHSTGTMVFFCSSTKIRSQFTFRSYMIEKSIAFGTRITQRAGGCSHPRKNAALQTGQGASRSRFSSHAHCGAYSHLGNDRIIYSI